VRRRDGPAEPVASRVGGVRGFRGVGLAGAVLGGVVLLAAGDPAAGQEPADDPVTVDDVATAIAADGWYADPDAVGDREQLAAVAERLGSGSEPMGFALLAEEPAGSSPAFAESVLDALAGHGAFTIDTVVVLSDADVGVVSDTWSDTAIDGALDETIDDLRANPTDGLEALADALADQPVGFGGGIDDFGGSDTSDDSGDGSSNTGLIVGGIVLLVALTVASRHLSPTDGEGGGDDGDDNGSSWSRRRRSSGSLFRSSSGSRHRSSSSSRSSSHRSSGSSSRGRGGRRL